MSVHNRSEDERSTPSLPAPGGASQPLIKAILDKPVPDIAATLQAVPTSEEAWLARIQNANAEMIKTVRLIKMEAKVSIERDALDGVTVFFVTPDNIDPRHEGRLFVNLHGGGYMLYGGESSLAEAIYIADSAKLPVLSIDYRMPPLYPFPAGLNDVIAVYKRLLESWSAKSIALGGTSAGAGLAMASIHRMNQLNLKVPGALFAGTPWSDLTKTGDSYWINEGVDRHLVTYDGSLMERAHIYAAGQDLKNPLLSPIYGNFEGFPPSLLVSGTRDLFLSNTVRAHTKLRAAGVIADLLVFEGTSHADYFLEADLPESRQTYCELNAFLLKHLQ